MALQPQGLSGAVPSACPRPSPGTRPGSSFRPAFTSGHTLLVRLLRRPCSCCAGLRSSAPQLAAAVCAPLPGPRGCAVRWRCRGSLPWAHPAGGVVGEMSLAVCFVPLLFSQGVLTLALPWLIVPPVGVPRRAGLPSPGGQGSSVPCTPCFPGACAIRGAGASVVTRRLLPSQRRSSGNCEKKPTRSCFGRSWTGSGSGGSSWNRRSRKC